MSAIAITAIVPAWTGSLTTRSTCSVIEPDHVERDDRDADRAQLVGRLLMSPPMIDPARTSIRARWQVRDRPDGVGDVVLADERDRVDRDPLAAEVVAVGLRDRAQRDLGDLRAAADDDHPLAEHLGQRPGQPDRADLLERLRARRGSPPRRRPRPPAPPRRVRRVAATAVAGQARRAGRSRASGSGRPTSPDGARDRAERARVVDDLEAAGDRGRQRLGVAAGHGRVRRQAAGRRRCRRSTGRWARAARRVVLLERDPERGERLAGRGRVAGREHQRAVGVLGDADDPGDVDAAVGERLGDPGERARAGRRAAR